MLRGEGQGAQGPAGSSGGGGSQPGGGLGDRDVCLYSDAQMAARELRALAPFLLTFGAPDSRPYLQHAEWVLSEALTGAASNYCGPGSTLLRAADLEVAAGATHALRRSHEAHMAAHVRAQLQLAMALPEASQRLVELQAENADSAMSVGTRMAAYPMMLLRTLRRTPYAPRQQRG
ncbi:hypothetical protein GPECTOR_11g264 [Gonium pectorale]|uniref:Uncharacterized protein n=1 Tax=Gonium pectorale TaxID=33097 RepID=A0A150GPU6_GONPE|nr:hypothetical protein GPECTOR_11g264 [Gonium pectorale]|eukprot:KXZ51824.1 hypothetical protein GPECTOR_11g264 [Gonium pectorale]